MTYFFPLEVYAMILHALIRQLKGRLLSLLIQDKLSRKDPQGHASVAKLWYFHKLRAIISTRPH